MGQSSEASERTIMSDRLAQRSCFSPRSGRQHKAWGVSPRTRKKENRAREAGDSGRTFDVNGDDSDGARYAGWVTLPDRVPGADAPGFMLPSAPRTGNQRALSQVCYCPRKTSPWA